MGRRVLHWHHGKGQGLTLEGVLAITINLIHANRGYLVGIVFSFFLFSINTVAHANLKA